MAKKETSGKSENAVKEQLTSTENFIDGNRRILIIGGAVIVVAILAVLGYQKFVAEPHAQQANDEYWNAFYDWQNDDTTGVAKTGTDQYLGFEDIASQYDGTPAGDISTYALATMAMEEGDFEGALGYLDQCEFEDVMLGSVVLGLKGDCQVELGDYETAASLFEEAANRESNNFTSPMFLKKAGLTFEELGNKEKAVELYQRIKDEFHESKEAMDIDKYIIRAQN